MITKAEFERDIEPLVGTFSRYKTTSGPGDQIPFHRKPAQQLLLGLGCITGAAAPLSETFDGSINMQCVEKVNITSFDDDASMLHLSTQRITFLLDSAKIYLNTDIISANVYRQLVGELSPQSNYVEPISGKHIQNLSVGICHVQQIDFLSEQRIDRNGCALMAPRSTSIDESAVGVLLLSSPALNFDYGKADELSPEDVDAFILGFYRNLFRATQNEGRQHVSMPAAGMGAFGGDPAQYFNALMTAAKEFPELTIIYNPAKYSVDFERALFEHKPVNVIQTRKDVAFIADILNSKGYLCALHNPSDSDVVLGCYDVGEYWKSGKGSCYVGEEHLGAMTTAPLNSRLLNPKAYRDVIEHCPSKGILPIRIEKPEVNPCHSLKGVSSVTSMPWVAFFGSDNAEDPFLPLLSNDGPTEQPTWEADFNV